MYHECNHNCDRNPTTGIHVVIAVANRGCNFAKFVGYTRKPSAYDTLAPAKVSCATVLHVPGRVFHLVVLPIFYLNWLAFHVTCLGIDGSGGALCASVSGNCTDGRLPFAPGVGSG